jgi:hypothetical protein
MPHYTRISSVWIPTVQPYNRISGTWRVDRNGYVNISGSWKYWFPNGYWSDIGANMTFEHSGPAGSNSESGNSATVFGGRNQFASPIPLTSEFNGTSWSSGGNMISARRNHGGTGTAASSLAFGGQTSTSVASALNSTEEYTASTNTWVSGGNLPRNITRLSGGAGTQTSGLSVGGQDNLGNVISTSYEYNGTSWSTGGNMSISAYERAGTGTQTAAVAAVGTNGTTDYLLTEEYNGTSWSSSSNSLLTRNGGANFCGTQTASLLFNGAFFSPTYSEEYDGSLWAIGGVPIYDREKQGTCSGGRSNALSAAGGSIGGNVFQTERYTRLI